MSRQRACRVALLGALMWTLCCVSWGLSASPNSPELEADLLRVKVGEGALAFSSGFITKTALPLDGIVHRITGDILAAGNRLLVGAADVIYLKFDETHIPALGDYHTLYRRIQEVYHPLRGTYLGELYMMVGITQVIDVSKNLAVARVIRSYSQITPGDGVMRFAAPPLPQPAATERRHPELPGTIVATTPSRFLVAQNQVVYIDWGAHDGLAVGDRINVHRTAVGLPARKIGELKILALEDVTATALIMKSTAPVLRGDRLALQQPSEKGEGSIAQELERLSQPAPVQEMPQAAAGGPEDLERRLAELARQLEFEQGSPSVTANSLPALKEISVLLQTVTDKQIRIEGHADDKPIGPSLKKQFPSNAELSVARAVGITSYLVEHGVHPSDLASVGHADKQPIAPNQTEEGRSQNRRIEIVLVPKETAGSLRLPESRPAPAEPPLPQAQPLPGLEEAPRVVPPEGEPAPPEKR